MYQDQEEFIAKKDFDLLLILDCLRADYFIDMCSKDVDHWKIVKSPASDTSSWLKYMTSKYDFSDICCVTANPEVSKYSKHFKHMIHVWKSGWQEINGVPTVPPDEVIDRIFALWQFRRVKTIAWFIQPHGPYPMHDPPVPVFRANPFAEKTNVKIGDRNIDKIIIDPKAEIEDPNSPITQGLLISAYRSNVEWVWNAIWDKLIPKLHNTKVVITADHGEALGELGLYGHWADSVLGALLHVPWVEVDV